jgi:O-antigen/teichoic acid export membrane protein
MFGNVFSGALQLTLASVLIRLISLVSFPVLTHLLAPEAYGVAGLATTFVGIFTILGMAGQDSSYVKCFHDADNYDRAAVDQFYSSYAWLAGGAAALLSCGAWLLFSQSRHVHSSDLVGVFVAIAVLGGVVTNFLQARARLIGAYTRLTIATFTAGISATFISILVAWLWRRDEIALLAGNLSFWIIFVMLPRVPPSRRGGHGLPQRDVKAMMSIGLPLLATAPAYWVLSSSDRWFLATYSSPTELGIYSVGVTIGSLGQMVTSALCNVWYPELSKRMHQTNNMNFEDLANAHTLLVWVLLVVCFGLCLFGSDIIHLLANRRYWGAVHYVPLIALGLTFYGINQFQGFGFTMARKNHVLPLVWVTGVGASLGLNWLLVPRYGGYGAAVSQCLSYLFVAIVTWFVSRRYMPFEPAWLRLIGCFLGLGAAAIYADSVLADENEFVSVAVKTIVFMLMAPATLAWSLRMSPSDLLRAAAQIYRRAVKRVGIAI